MHWWISYSFISINLLFLFCLEGSTIVTIILFFLKKKHLCTLLKALQLSSSKRHLLFIIAEQHRRGNSEIPHGRSYITEVCEITVCLHESICIKEAPQCTHSGTEAILSFHYWNWLKSPQSQGKGMQ